MTVEEVITAVRLMLIDKGAVQELTDKDYVAFLNAGMRLVWQLCPHSRLTSTGRTLTTWVVASEATPSVSVCVDDAFMPALLDYVMFRYYDRDSGDSRDKTLSKVYWDRFSSLLDLRR